MSREIKFRMVTQTTGEIIGYTDVYRLLRHGEDELGDNFEKAILDGINFEQYTGIKDKNGKEIYEGDIMSSGHVVRFSDDEDEVGSCGCCVDAFWGSGFIVSTSYRPSILNVIGNIHENPELLGGEE